MPPFVRRCAPFLAFALVLAAAPAHAQQAPLRCGLPANLAPGFGIDNPDCDFFRTNPAAIYAPGSLLRIPVVVHVIQSTSGSGNLSDAQVRSQITVLNEDFRALPGTAGAPGVDTRIEFFLATSDPNGNPTTGIVRHVNDTWYADNGAYWNAIAWPTSRYLNIYSNNVGNGQALGYVPDLPQGGTALNTSADRVVIWWRAFGRPGQVAPYHQGRTCTHEVGHYLGLFHTFDNGCGTSSCYTTGDRICDTNAEANPRSGCPTSAVSCGSADPIRNYLDYTDDLCMNHFTQEQARRMRCTLQHYRPQLAQPAGPIATATVRPGAGNLNTAYMCTAPRLGQTSTASVILVGTPFTQAAVLGFTGPATAPLAGFTVLVDLASPLVLELPLAGGLVPNWSIAVPNSAGLAGAAVSTQAVLLGSTFALSNAVDLVVGS